MAALKLPKLPDRAPVKLTISVSPDLQAALEAYAQAYETAYGRSESVADLVPYILQAFIENDREFNKARKNASKA